MITKKSTAIEQVFEYPSISISTSFPYSSFFLKHWGSLIKINFEAVQKQKNSCTQSMIKAKIPF
jgi:hypothetical protein